MEPLLRIKKELLIKLQYNIPYIILLNEDLINDTLSLRVDPISQRDTVIMRAT